MGPKRGDCVLFDARKRGLDVVAAQFVTRRLVVIFHVVFEIILVLGLIIIDAFVVFEVVLALLLFFFMFAIVFELFLALVLEFFFELVIFLFARFFIMFTFVRFALIGFVLIGFAFIGFVIIRLPVFTTYITVVRTGHLGKRVFQLTGVIEDFHGYLEIVAIIIGQCGGRRKREECQRQRSKEMIYRFHRSTPLAHFDT